MGRLFGRRPDPTPSIARAVEGHLAPGEQVTAAVHLQVPGTNSAALQAGASAATGATAGVPPTFGPDDDGQAGWAAAATAFGVEADVARRMSFASLALTPWRLLLVRRSATTRRPAGVVASWPVAEVDRIEVPRNGGSLVVHRGGAALPFELPVAHKFLPDVYRDLPRLLATAQAAAADL